MGLIRKAAKKAADKAEDVVLGKSEKDIQSVERAEGRGRREDERKGRPL